MIRTASIFASQTRPRVTKGRFAAGKRSTIALAFCGPEWRKKSSTIVQSVSFNCTL